MNPTTPHDRSPHEPVGKVRTGLRSVHNKAFGSSHIKTGSRAFDVMFRFVGGISLGAGLASIALGSDRGLQIISKSLHHPFTDGAAMGFMIGIFLAPFVYAYLRAKEEFARRAKQERPEFKWIGRRAALITFVLAFVTLFLIGADSIDLRPARYR